MSTEESICVYSFKIKINASTLKEALFFIDDFVSNQNVPELTYLDGFSSTKYEAEECIDFDEIQKQSYPDCFEFASYDELKDQQKNTGFLIEHSYIAYLNHGRIADVEQISNGFVVQETPWKSQEVNLETPQFKRFLHDKTMESHLQKNVKKVPAAKPTPSPSIRF